MGTKTEELNVKGMHCKSCEMLIEDSVSEIKGVSHVKAHLTKNKVSVKFDESKAKIEDIKKAIESEGYKVE
jgi:copper ion binding protein